MVLEGAVESPYQPGHQEALRVPTVACRGAGELGGRRAASPGFDRGSPSSCCPGSQWRGRWTSAGGSGLGTALSSRPPARCTWLRESRRGSVMPRPRRTHSWVTLHTQTRRGLVPRYLPDSVMGGSTGHNPGSTWAPLPNVFSSPFPFAKPSKHIYFLTNRFMFFFFLAVKNLLGKLSDGFSTQQLQCYNQGTNSAAAEKCFPLEKKGKRLPPGNNEVCNLREGKGKGRAPRRKAREGPLGTSRREACPLCHCAAPRTPPGTSWHLFIMGVGGAGGGNQLRRN